MDAAAECTEALGGGPGTDPARAVATAFSRLEAHRRGWEQRTPLGVAEMRLLWLLRSAEEWTLRDITAHLGLEQSTVNRQVNAAVSAGLVTKLRTPGQPSFGFRASDEGVRRFEACVGEVLGRYQHALDALGEDAERFVDLLDRFVDDLVAERPGAD
ncbi:MarR family winged helix-turn-helix transcriptional regulator [Nocardioides nitrophenolicus]|uniref:MarR family winged helix-turn-helix transcriptional regulator n=1 Tax=Nocardioides nitrophenolicus TaxID=60489 RepID=UPI00195A7F22|nr:MarR family winged helix-turn-helix transcriptional regulator [Nocardioides nitrophenolicus]MBM7516131.1 DNA-binding MarR family transcriptional regulator [Nocardioides nitrophenolicus]